MEIRIIDEAHKADIALPNEAFALTGKLIPRYVDEQWDYSIRRFPEEEITEMTFPDEDYDYNEMKENSVFLGAYEGEVCIGLAILQDAWFRYMYIYDLKVARSFRGKGVASALLTRAGEIAKARGYGGIYTQGQDNNLSACLFYLKTGFHIGGLDTNVYRGTRQEGKSDVIFYLDL